MSENKIEFWEIWYSKAAAAGLYFARCRIDPQEVVLVHAPPEVMTVFVRSGNGALKAQGKDLKATGDSPMARLTCRGGEVLREDIWPEAQDNERVVLLPGGEAGVLKSWWNAGDQSEWRWTVEFYNQK
jgi:hypothetical protein